MTDVARFRDPPRRSPARRLARRAAARLAGAFAPASERTALRILTYHRVNDRHPGDRLTVTPDAFRRQLEVLAASGRPVVSLAGAIDAMRAGNGPPGGAVAITFDDGYRDNHDEAFRVLDAFGFPATFFLATAYVGSRLVFPRYRGCCAEDGGLDWAQVRDMLERGHDLGGHTRTHPELARISIEEARREIRGCREDIARETGLEARLFCYPRGSETEAIRRAVGDAGFDAACSVYPGSNPPGTDLMALRRTEVSGNDTLADFRLKLAGHFDAWHRLVQRAHGLRPR